MRENPQSKREDQRRADRYGHPSTHNARKQLIATNSPKEETKERDDDWRTIVILYYYWKAKKQNANQLKEEC